MVYKNFILRSIISFLFLFIYVIIISINFKYILYLILILYLLVVYEILIYFKKNKLVPITYIIISFVFFLNINFNDDIYPSFNLFIISVITFDIFSYLIGKLFGKNKLIKISPNKTIEGFLGGFILSLILSLFSSHYYFGLIVNINLIFFIIIILFSALIGDLIESYYKRKNNIKNSSQLIPGHGGVFDRFDSFLFSIIIYSISVNSIL